MYLLITFPVPKGQEKESRVVWKSGESSEPQVYQPEGVGAGAGEAEMEEQGLGWGRDGGGPETVCGCRDQLPRQGARTSGQKGDAGPGSLQAAACDETLQESGETLISSSVSWRCPTDP